MADPRDNKGKPSQSSRPVQQPAAGTPARKDSAAPAPPSKPGAPQLKPGEADHRAGRVVHDARGNAVWNWVKETGRICIDSTSALLKKLDFGDLKIEGEKDEGLRLEDPGRDAGGGYDPYNQKTVPKKGKPVPPKK